MENIIYRPARRRGGKWIKSLILLAVIGSVSSDWNLAVAKEPVGDNKSMGVPHVYAHDQADLGRVLGFTLARDRTWESYDEAMAATCLQGIINRQSPELYVLSRQNPRRAQ